MNDEDLNKHDEDLNKHDEDLNKLFERIEALEADLEEDRQNAVTLLNGLKDLARRYQRMERRIAQLKREEKP